MLLTKDGQRTAAFIWTEWEEKSEWVFWPSTPWVFYCSFGECHVPGIAGAREEIQKSPRLQRRLLITDLQMSDVMWTHSLMVAARLGLGLQPPKFETRTPLAMPTSFFLLRKVKIAFCQLSWESTVTQDAMRPRWAGICVPVPPPLSLTSCGPWTDPLTCILQSCYTYGLSQP